MMLLLTAALAWTPTLEDEALVRALSGRDGAPPCAELEETLSDPVDSLSKVVEHVQMPPWAPMYAAACLIEGHATEAPELLERWVADPETKGLAKLVVNRLHLLDEPQARDLASRSLSGPHRETLSRSIKRSPDAGIRALATTP